MFKLWKGFIFVCILIVLSGTDIFAKSGFQLHSWCNPYAKDKLIGQIYFPDNGAYLSTDDEQAIDRLIKIFNAWGDSFVVNPYELFFLGTADPRNTSYPGGNKALSEDRASAVWDYFERHLSSDAKKSVVSNSKGYGAIGGPEACKKLGSIQYGLARRRMVAIFRPPQEVGGLMKDQDPIPPLQKRRPAESREKALERCRTILLKYPSWFYDHELTQLQHICNESTTDDGFMNGMDPELIRIAFGMGGDFKNHAELKAFVDRFKVSNELMHYSAASPDALEVDVAAAMKSLYSRINGGLAMLMAGKGKDTISGCGNMRRVRLIRYALEASNDSIYFGWPKKGFFSDCPRGY